MKRKLHLQRVSVVALQRRPPHATNSSQCGACSCEQHCEQAPSGEPARSCHCTDVGCP